MSIGTEASSGNEQDGELFDAQAQQRQQELMLERDAKTTKEQLEDYATKAVVDATEAVRESGTPEHEVNGRTYADITTSIKNNDGSKTIKESAVTQATQSGDLSTLNDSTEDIYSRVTTVESKAPTKGLLERPDMEKSQHQRTSDIEKTSDATVFVETKTGSTGNTISRKTELETDEDGVPVIRTTLQTTSPDGDVIRKKELEYSQDRKHQSEQRSEAAIRTAEAIGKRVADAQPKPEKGDDRILM